MAIKTKRAISRLRLPFFKRLKGRGTRASDISDASSDAFILFDRNLNIVGMNPVVRSVFHLILGEKVIGEDVPSGVPNMKSDNRNNGRYEKYLNAIRKGKPFFADSIVVHSGLLDINIKAEAFKVGRGFGIIFSDIDALKKTEKTPNDPEGLAINLQSTPDCIFVFDLKGTILHGSKAGEGLTGYAWEEIKGKSYLEIPLFAPEYLPKAAQLLELSASGKPAGPDEFELIRKDGGHVYVEISTCPIGRGDEVEVIAIARDITERKQSEEALRQSEERYKSIVETSLDGVYQVDTSGKFTFINESFAKAFGYKREELLGKHFSSLLSIETFPKVKEMVGQVLAGENVREEVPVQHKDGHEVLVSFGATPLKSNGRIIGLTGILRDITERKRMEEELTNSEAKYRSFIETTSAGIATIDLKGEFTLVNEALCRMIGYSQEELLGRNFADFLHPDDKENLLDIFAKGLEGEKEHPVLEFRGIHKDGHSVWCYCSPTPIVQGDEMTGFSAVIRDIAERKRVQEALRDSEAKYRSLIETAGAGVAATDLRGEFVLVNEALCRMIGYSQEELLGRNFADFLHPDDKNEVLEIFAKGLAGEKEPPHLEFRVIHKDGHNVWCYSTPTAIVHGEELIGFSAIIHDITERKRAEEELNESEAKFKNLVALAPDAIMTMDLDGIVTSWNISAERITGYSAGEMIGKHFSDFETVPPEDAPRYLKIFESLLRGQVPETFEAAMLHKDGTHRLVDVNIGLIEKGGKYVGLQVISRDITERKQAEEALRESEGRFRAIIENAPFGYYRVGKDGLWQYVNAVWERMHGFSLEEVMGKPLEITQTKDDVEQARELVKRALAGESIAGEFSRLTKEGNKEYHTFNIQPVKRDKEIAAIEGFISDITERKKAEEDLRDSEEKYRLLAENVTDVIWTMDMDLRFTYISSSVTCLRGLTVKEAMAERLEDIFSPSSFQALVKTFEEGMVAEATGLRDPSRSWTLELEENCKDGSLIWVEIRAGLLRDQDGRPVGLVGVTRNITERKKAEEELRQSEGRFRKVLDNAIDMIYWLNLKTGEYDYVAPSSEKVIGYAPDELMALGIVGGRSLVHPDDSERLDQNVIDLVMNAGNGNAAHGIEYRFAHKKLGYRWIFDNRSIVYEGNEAVAIVGTVRDITERKQAEQALRESEASYRELADSIGDVFFALGDNLRYVYWNNASETLTGIKAEDAIGKSIYEVFGDTDQTKRSADKYLEVLATQQSQTFENEFQLGGKRYVFEIHAYSTRRGISVFARDITERRLAEEAVRESERKFRSVLEHSVDVIYQLNLGTATYDYVSPSSIGALGYSPEELIALGFEKASSILHPDDVKMMREHFNKLMKPAAADSKEPPTIEYRVKHRKSGYRWMSDTSSVLCDDNNVPIAITGNVRDITKRKQAEEGLKESEERYRALVDTAGLAGEGIMIVERVEGNKAVIVFVNDALSGMLGYQQEEMPGMPARELFLPGDRIWLQDRNRRKRKGEALSGHYGVMALRKDGSMLPIEISMGAMRYQGNMATVVYVRDVTERKKAEESLRESEAQFRAIFDGAAIGVGLLSIVGQPFRINPALQEMLGYTLEELRSMAFTDYMHADDATVDAGLFREMLRGKRDHYQVEKRYIRKDGQMVWGRMTLSAVRGLGGKLQFAIGMIEDITDSKLALEKLSESEKRFRSLTENASEVVLLIDKEGTITYASPSVERILGYKLEEGIGSAGFSFIHPDDMPQVMGLFEQMIQNPGGTLTAKVRVRHKDGSWLIAEAIGRNLLDNPAVEGIVVNYRDVTERERAQEELLRHTKRVEALHAIAQAASQTLELEELLNASLDKVMEVMEAEAGCVYLLDMVEKEFVLRTSRGVSDEAISRLATIRLNENNIEKIKEWKGGSNPLRKVFGETGLSITKEAKQKEQIQSFAVAPFAVRGQLSGLIAVGNRSHREFSSGDMDLLRSVGNQIGIGAQNAVLYEEVRALIRETIDAQETERERVCLEVHDGVAQTLVSAFQYLQALEATAPEDTKTKQLLAKTSAQVKLAIQESREIINSLQPATLSDLGLVSTLRHELKRLGQETGLKIDFKADAIRLPKDIETGLYRIIREAVFNARKHANTKQLRVRINSEDERVRVEVRDWGKGFDQAYLDRARKRGTGLFSIRKRAELMKGDCEIQSEPGRGTTVRVEIPVSAAERSSG